MKYQYYVITPDPEPREQAVYRMFIMPVHEVDGEWRQAGEAKELEGDSEEVEMNVIAWRIYGRPPGIGHLDEVKPPRGWTVVARDWLPDDYVPPTDAEREQAERDALGHWQKIQEAMRHES